MSSLEGGGLREEGVKPSPSGDMLTGQSQAGEGCVATPRSSSEMGESWASFLGTTLGWRLKPLGRILATLASNPELC